MKKQIKTNTLTVRITDDQQKYIDKLIEQGKAKTNAAAIQYLINKSMLLNPKGE